MAAILGNPDASVVMIQMVDDHDLASIESEVEEIKNLTDDDFCLIAIKVRNWNHDLSPWKAPAVFGKEGFGDGANATLQEVLKHCVDRNKTYIIGGYSLAGLFALWAAYQTDVFVCFMGGVSDRCVYGGCGSVSVYVVSRICGLYEEK